MRTFPGLTFAGFFIRPGCFFTNLKCLIVARNKAARSAMKLYTNNRMKAGSTGLHWGLARPSPALLHHQPASVSPLPLLRRAPPSQQVARARAARSKTAQALTAPPGKNIAVALPGLPPITWWDQLDAKAKIQAAACSAFVLSNMVRLGTLEETACLHAQSSRTCVIVRAWHSCPASQGMHAHCFSLTHSH